MPEDAECIVCNVFPFLDLFVIFVTFLMSNSICFLFFTVSFVNICQEEASED